MSTGVGTGVVVGEGCWVSENLGVGARVGGGVVVGRRIGVGRTALSAANGVGAGVGAGMGLGVPEIAGTRGSLLPPFVAHVTQGVVMAGAGVFPGEAKARIASCLCNSKCRAVGTGASGGAAASGPGVALAMMVVCAMVVAVTDSETRAADSPLPTNRVVEGTTIAATTNTAMIEIVTQTTIRRIYLSPIT